MEIEKVITVENISKDYKLTNSKNSNKESNQDILIALNDISFEICKGESVGIIGPNGSGKSTLLKILAGVIKPTFGKIEIKGKVASILDIGSGFHPELSGRENVFLNGQIHGFSKKEIQERFNEIVEFSGISSFIDEPVKNYSQGMFLRLAFSIIVHLDFDVYLFDEVFSVGDAEFNLKTRAKFQQLITSDKTMVFVSHNINELADQDKYILLKKGIIKEVTNNKNILSKYLEEVLRADNIEVASKNICITDFSDFPQSEDIKIHSIELTQNEIHFRTDRAFRFSIVYEKKNNEDTFDVLISINDSQGIPILTSSPIIIGNFNEFTNDGKYIYTCTIPSCFFNSKVYRLSLNFLKNANNYIKVLKSKDISNDYGLKNSKIDFELSLINVLTFKPIYRCDDFEADLEGINLKGNLLPAFTWELKNDINI